MRFEHLLFQSTKPILPRSNIELLGAKLIGKDGVKKWLDWLFKHMSSIKFVPITIMVEGNVFLEEFIARVYFLMGRFWNQNKQRS
ncbi:MAG: hypothetical protein EAX81_07750 [Candidatus Thorarchaeota archaeon]|nr:hypothetical protein [Candidatus Thorarchaeota archaeon]